MSTSERVLFSIGLVSVVIGLGVIIKYYHDHPCIESHNELVHHNSYTSYIMVGKIMVPQMHSAYDSVETVCDKRK